MLCDACNIYEQHVLLSGYTLCSLNSNQIKTIIDECTQVKPIHVKKDNESDNFCHLHFASKKDAATFYHFFSCLDKLLCRRLGKSYVGEASDFNGKMVEYDGDLVEEEYHESCICQSASIPISSRNDSNNDANISPLVLSFYEERKKHLVVEIKEREKILSRKRQEAEDDELVLLKRVKELAWANEIVKLL